jgi:hypothetical protein
VAQPTDSTYSVQASPIRAGFFAGGAFAGAINVADAVAAGSMQVNASAFAGAVVAGDGVAGGAMVGAAGLPSWVSALPLMEWYGIPNTQLSSVTPVPTPSGNLGPRGKIEAWNGATLKRSGSVYMLGAAGGHRDYGGNEVNAIALNTETPQWVELCPPTPNNLILADGNNGAQWYLDLKPSCTHTYHATQFIDSLNRMMVFNSPGYNGPGGTWPPPATPPWTLNGLSFSFNVATGQWDAPTYVAATPATGDFTSCLCVKHPVTNDVYYSMGTNGANGWWRWNAATNTWTDLPGASRSTWFCGAAVDPVRNRILTVGGYPVETDARVFDLDGIGLAATFGGLGQTELRKAEQYTSCVYDEALDCYWALYIVKDAGGGPIGSKLLRIDAATWFVEAPVTTGLVIGARPNGFHNALQYVPELRGITLADDFNGTVKFMRTAL